MHIYKKIIVIILSLALVAGVVFFFIHRMNVVPAEPPVTTTEMARTRAEEWIKTKAPTYVYDGSDLTSIDTRALDCTNCFSSTFMFTSAHSGYGNRDNVLTLQVITQHIIEVIFRNGIVHTVITDGEYDEIAGRGLNQKDLMSVMVYYGNSKENPNATDCSKVFPVERITEKQTPPHKIALELLLQGPDADEKKEGYYTSINKGVELKSFSIKDGTAYADFNTALDKGVAGSCRVAAIRAEITETLKQFPSIKNVIISVEGKTEDILQP